jgi:hypothetical protein
MPRLTLTRLLTGAKRHHLEPWAYLRDALLRLSVGETDLEPFLPARWGADHPEFVLQHRLDEARPRATRTKERSDTLSTIKRRTRTGFGSASYHLGLVPGDVHHELDSHSSTMDPRLELFEQAVFPISIQARHGLSYEVLPRRPNSFARSSGLMRRKSSPISDPAKRSISLSAFS